MGYLTEIKTQIKKRDFSKFLLLWEEYCFNDTVDVKEYKQILEIIKGSDFGVPFGKYVEMGLELWKKIEDKESSYQVLKLIVDIQTANRPELGQLVSDVLKSVHGEDPLFHERIRLIGLRNLSNFQGALSNYDLLAHMKVGNCVFHTAGWGTGEIMEVSTIREQLAIEFDNVAGRKHISFSNAFKTLVPLPSEHFLARRFVDADNFESEARENPLEVIKVLLRDLGPKTAGEIKDELCDFVIPDKDWAKWWQAARAKLKKDTMIETPDNLQSPFVLRNKEITHEERFQREINAATEPSEIILTAYNCVRDFPNILKKKDIADNLKERLQALLLNPGIRPSQEIQIAIFFEVFFGQEPEKGRSVNEIVTTAPNIEEIINSIEIIAFKKRALTAVKSCRKDWANLFLNFLVTIQQSQLRDYLLKEVANSEGLALLEKKLGDLRVYPEKDPEMFLWYFNKVMDEKGGEIPYASKEGKCQLFDSFLVLLHKIENNSAYKDQIKKMHNMITNKRYELVRTIIEGTSLEFIKEFLLLASKCHTFTDHDIKILQSLAQVVHPSLTPDKHVHDRLQLDGKVIWTTEKSYRRIHEQMQHIGTVEIVENAREVEIARSHGDLRENSEYKFAVERRRQLQGQLKNLSEELNRARIITPQDINTEEVGIGSVVEVSNQAGEVMTYTLLGPWDADPENNILSFQSKLAQAMIGSKVKDKFTFRDESYTIQNIKSYLEQ